MTIYGIDIDESKELEDNLSYLRTELEYRLSFYYPYDLARDQLRANSIGGELSGWDRLALFIWLLPMRFSYLFSSGDRKRKIREAEDSLIEYYHKPETRIRRLRKASHQEKERYAAELKIIRDEIQKLEENEQSTVIKPDTKQQIRQLILAYQAKEEKRAAKHRYYELCERKLTEVEEQLFILKSIQESKEMLAELKAADGEEAMMEKIGKETELYTYYGEVAEDIAKDMRKVEEDTEEQIERLELELLMEKVRAK